MNRKTLWNVGLRYLIHHPWQSALMVLGITLGVAVVVSVDLANASASRAFDLSVETVAGRATHQITAGPQGLDESLYTRLRRLGLPIASAPVINEYVASPQLGEVPLQLLGIDPFAEPPFRNYLDTGTPGSASPISLHNLASGDLIAFLTQPGALLVSDELARSYSLSIGQPISLEVAGRTQPAFIAGLLQPNDALSRRALENLVLADIATAQELTGHLGKLDRIDLILPQNEKRPLPGGLSEPSHSEIEAQIQALLPPNARLQPMEARSGAVEQMTNAFRLNLTALSLLALAVGMFLIYNTITFSVVQRRSLFGVLRCLGVTRQEVFSLVMVEALAVGALGALLGIALGVLMGQGAVRLVTQTINDLFFVVSVRGVQIPIASLVKGGALGVVATLLTAAPPAWEAASVPPRQALLRSSLESKAGQAMHLAALGGLALIALGAGFLFLFPRSLWLSFAGTFAVVIGFALLVPITTSLLMRCAVPVLGRVWGTLGRMAPRDVANSLSRTSIAVMALMVAVSVTIGVSLMVHSFRTTVIAWLGETLQGDVYLSAPGLIAATPSTPIDPQALETVRNWPGVVRTDVQRSVTVGSPQGEIHISANDNSNLGNERIYLSADVPPDEIWGRLQAGEVLISEPFANRLNLPRHGGSVTLYTDAGLRVFPIVGIYYDYATTQGTVLMALAVYRQYWQDNAITAIALRLQPGSDVSKVVHGLQNALLPIQRLVIRPNQALRQDVLAIFDRTFAITAALQLLATVVAFIGVLSALLSLELERQHELGILRSVGMTVRQLWGLILLETGLMGATAGLLAMPAGYILGLILVFIINRRSFGWTLQMQVDLAPFLQALAVAVIAALLAGIYPAFRTGKTIISEALRTE